MRKHSRDFVMLGILVLLPWLLFTSITIGNKTLLPADALYLFEPFAAGAAEAGVETVHNPLLLDLVLQNYAWKQFLIESVANRSLPLWNPDVFSGIPFWATGQHSALYPLTWLFFVFSPTRAFGLFFVLQLGIAGCSMYILGRVLRMKPGGAYIAGLIFQLSGFMIMSAVHPMIQAAASWLPLLLAMQELTVRRARFLSRERAMLPWALLGACIVGLQFFAGHAEISYFIILVMALYAAWRLACNAVQFPRTLWRAEVLSPAAGLLLMVIIGVALAAVQLLPFYQAAEASFRQDAVTLQQVLGWAYPKRRLITFLIPNFFGNPTHRALLDVFSGVQIPASVNAYGQAINAFDWGIKNFVEGAAYVGIMPLVLAVLAILRPPQALSWLKVKAHQSKVLSALRTWLGHPYIPFFSGLALFSLGCVFGTPLYALVFALPFINQSHSPFRWVFPLTVALAALAGFGVTTLAEQRESAADNKRLWKYLRLGASRGITGTVSALSIWGGLAMAAGIVGSRLMFSSVEPFVERAFFSLAKAAYAFPDSRAFYSYEAVWVFWAALLLVMSGVAMRVSGHLMAKWKRGWRRFAVLALLAILVVLDLMVFSHGFNPAVDASLMEYRPAVVDWLQQDTSSWRFSTFDPKGAKTFDVNTGMYFDMQDVRGYDSLFSGQYARYMGWIAEQDELPYNRIAPFKDFTALDSPLVDLLNVKYIISETDIPLPKYKEVYRDESVIVYENLGMVPRAFTLPQTATVWVSDVAAVGQAIQTYDPRFYVIVENSADAWTYSDAGREAIEPQPAIAADYQAQEIVAYADNEVTVAVTTDEPVWLVLGDAFESGWKAFVRAPDAGLDAETQVSIARVAGNFRGVRVDGDCLVRFKYSPDGVKIGAFTSFIAGMVILLAAVIWLWRSVYRKPETTSTVGRVAKNSVIPIALNIFNQVVTFAFAALTLRILGPGDSGAYYTAGIMFGWFEIIANFGLNTWLTREVARHPQQARRYFFSTTMVRLVLIVVVIPLVLGFIVLRQTVIADLTQPASRQTIIALVLLYIGLVPSTVNTGFSALFYAFEKAEYPAMVTSVTTLMRVTLGTLAILMGLGGVGLAGASIIVNLVTLVILAAMAFKIIPHLHKTQVVEDLLPAKPRTVLRREMISESWPLMLNHLLSMLFYKFDVTLMEAILGESSVGLYSIGYKLIDALMVIPSMFTMALFPVISRQADDNQAAFLRFYKLGTKILLSIVLFAALVTTFLANEMVLILGGAEYLPGGRITLQIIVWALPFSWINGLTQYVLIALNRQRYLTLAYIGGFLFSLLGNLWLMPRFGYEASAWLHIAAELMLFIPFAIDMRRQIGKIGWWQIVRYPVLSAICAAAFASAGMLVHRGVAVMIVLVGYPLLLWRLGLFDAQEKQALRPLMERLPFKKKQKPEPLGVE